MKTVFSPLHREHHGQAELFGGRLVPCYEQPARIDAIHAHLLELGLGEVVPQRDHGRAPLESVHATDYLNFLEQAWEEWTAAGNDGDALACCAPRADMSLRIPKSIYGKVCYFSFDATAPITSGTWLASYASAQVALTGADLVDRGDNAAFALCRPPGHHASAGYYGGYCYLNNAAIAAQAFIHKGATRVVVLDVDYHHGNGTQSIFYHRNDVMYISIHGDPNHNYPFFLGYPDEIGVGRGEGFNLNLPLPIGTDARSWFDALDKALKSIAGFMPEVMIVSLGVDTFEGDPISHFKLKSEDYLRLGERLAMLRVPTLFVMEGGYNLDAIGKNVSNVLNSFF